jgi:phage terminase large subunit-like protein
MTQSATQVEQSEAARLAARLVEQFGHESKRVAGALFKSMPAFEAAALFHDWSFWARPKQRAPTGPWRTWFFLTGRGHGKTLTISSYINGEIEAGRASLLCLTAQDEANSVAIQVLGPSGLIATAPPWFKPHWEASKLELVYPNGARAYVRTPEVPGKIRGLEYHLSWASELQSWPTSTQDEAFSNIRLSTRLGYGRTIYDATPKRRHPLLQELLQQHEADPATHVVVRGTTHENAANLGEGYVAEMERKFGGTLRGREELLGEMLTDAENALVKQEWIDGARRNTPTRVVRRVVSIDPAVTNRPGSDTTGIIEAGVGDDGQGYVFGDDTGKYDPQAWGTKVLDRYTRHDCDLVIAETNKGGALVTQNLRALAQERGLEVIVVGKDEKPSKVAGKVFVKEVHARGSKDVRAEPVATSYERKRVSHVNGVDLSRLEETLTNYEPPADGTAAARRDSPGDLDALVHAMVELLDLSNNQPDLSKGFVGIGAVAKQITAPMTSAPSVTRAFSASLRGGRGDRI